MATRRRRLIGGGYPRSAGETPGYPAGVRPFTDRADAGRVLAGHLRHVAGVGTLVGIPFAFGAIARMPNTRDAHRLISWAQAQGDADALVERLFRAYFLDGRYIGDHAVLAAVAGEAGLDAEAARAYLATQQGDDTIVAMDRRVRELGIGGVPFFIFDGRVGVSGAQEPETLLAAIAEARGAASGGESPGGG